MTVGFSGVQASVTITGAVSTSFPVPTAPFSGLDVAAYGAGAGKTILTPTAGKKFYLMGFTVQPSASSHICVGDNISSATASAVNACHVYVVTTLTSTYTVSLSSPVQVSTALKLYSSAACDVYFSYWGYEV